MRRIKIENNNSSCCRLDGAGGGGERKESHYKLLRRDKEIKIALQQNQASLVYIHEEESLHVFKEFRCALETNNFNKLTKQLLGLSVQ